jgi:hypothetical protein
MLAEGRPRFVERARTAASVTTIKRDEPRLLHVSYVTSLSAPSQRASLVKKTADLCSVPVKLLRHEIKKIAAHVHRGASSDELDRAWATLSRLQDALALATERAKSLAD